jgi:hypothetical protein
VSAEAPFELRLKRRWRFAIGLGVPLFGLLLIAGSAAVLSGRSSGFVAIAAVVFIVATLGGLIVLPGALLIVRSAQGIPDLLLDERGIVWGRDRRHDQSLDWDDVAAVITKRIGGDMPERAFILRIQPGRSGSLATSAGGRILMSMNRLRYGTTWSISTAGADRPWEEIRAALGEHLPASAFELEGRPGRG